MRFGGRVLVFGGVVLGGCGGGEAASGGGGAAPQDPCAVPAFAPSEAVTIEGYDGYAMEPFLSRDGGTLYFNDSNDPANDTQLHWATRVDDLRFQYEGEIAGAQSALLDGVPSVVGSELFFVSLRSYESSLSTVHRATLVDGVATDVSLVAGVSREQAPWVVFDVDVSADGQTLLYADGYFDAATGFWRSADLVAARRAGDAFGRDETRTTHLAAVNTDALEYAATTSEDERLLYFTRIVADVPRIFVAARGEVSDPFCAPVELAEAEGFVEGPTVAPDGAVYFHQRGEGGRYALRRAGRL